MSLSRNCKKSGIGAWHSPHEGHGSEALSHAGPEKRDAMEKWEARLRQLLGLVSPLDQRLAD